MKRFNYRYSILQTGALTNSDGTNVKRNSNGGIEIYDNSWDQYLEDAIVPEITYTATNATSVDRTVKAWTFYCDSMSGCDASSPHYKEGDGSKENPWRSVEFALKQIQQKLTCWRNVGCLCYRKQKYFQLKIKGDLDYRVSGYGFDGAERIGNDVFHQFIISPWESQNLLLNGFFYWIHGTIFNNLEIHTDFILHDYERPLEDHTSCLFNHLKIIEIPHDFNIKIAVFCHSSKFIDVTLYAETYNGPYSLSLLGASDNAEIVGLTSHNVTVVYVVTSRIYNANVNIMDSSSRVYKDILGFRQSGYYLWDIAYLYNCSANVSGVLSCEADSYGDLRGYVDAVGFYDPFDDTFYYNCTTTNQCEKCADETHVCRTPDF